MRLGKPLSNGCKRSDTGFSQLPMSPGDGGGNGLACNIDDMISQLVAFREQVYQHFHQRADALFEMLDGLLSLPSATAPAHMLLQPHFQRKWGSIYDALSYGRINTTGGEDLVAQYLLDGGDSVYAVDSSTWLKNDAVPVPSVVTIIITRVTQQANPLSPADPISGSRR